MTYREILKLYKAGKLDEETAKKVKEEIEKQDAISEYLFDEMDSELDLHAKSEGAEQSVIVDSVTANKKEDRAFNLSEDRFTAMIRKSIRRAFLKMGACVTAVVLVIVILSQTLLPKLVDHFYYDPGEIVVYDGGYENNRLGLDLGVYTEVLIPEHFRTSAAVTDRGYGNYDIVIPQIISHNGENHSIAGTISRGEMNLYDVDTFSTIFNLFGWFQMDFDTELSLKEYVSRINTDSDSDGMAIQSFVGTREQAQEFLEELDSASVYNCYVTLDHIMTYDEFYEFIKENDVYAKWAAVATQSYLGGNCPKGFAMVPYSGIPGSWESEEYPLLTGGSELYPNYDPSPNAEKIQTHFTSMLRYLADHIEFVNMIGSGYETTDEFDSAADFVEENGLYIYGFMTTADKEEALRLQNLPEVYEVGTRGIAE